MARIYETQDSAHREAVARALLEAAGEDNPDAVRTVYGANGQMAFEVADDFPDVTVPEPGGQEPDEDTAAAPGALHPATSGVLGDTERAQETQTQPQQDTGQQEESGGSRRARRSRSSEQSSEQEDSEQQ